jgi:formylmethanofuran dehydrogenase subunit B
MTVTCLGCGCGCDDLQIELHAGRITSITPPCPLALAWFGDGRVPDRVLVSGRAVAEDEAVAAAAELLAQAKGRVLVVLAPDLTTEAQRGAVALADLLRATVDSATSPTAAEGLLAAQRRGRAAATLGEIRNRADVLLFWGTDPSAPYPRYLERYALAPAGTQVPGRAARTVISVSVGADRGPAQADLELSLTPEEELDALSAIRATVLGNRLGELPDRFAVAAEIGTRLLGARYAAVIHDGEPGAERRSPYRSEGLLALAQALNHTTRAALSTLRAGGNRTGAEAVLTWQTGYPMGVDFTSGVPRYQPALRGLDRVAGGAFELLLLAGSAAALSDPARKALARHAAVVIGPGASRARLDLRVAIDTGVAGIHEPGIGYRMDEVPLPLTPPLPGMRTAAGMLQAVLDAIRVRLTR